jgi:hypothetical protein
MNSKICNKCKIEKPLSEFSNKKTGRLGKDCKCKECGKILSKEWYYKNIEKATEYRHSQECREREAKRKRELYQNNPSWKEKQSKINKKSREQPHNRKRRSEYIKKWKKVTKNRIACNLRMRLRVVLNGTKKIDTTFNLIGCSLEHLKSYLESKFQTGMSWDNYGFGMDKWNIDHILPCASFDLIQESEQRKCFHYTNLQPLWQKENLSKKDKILPNLLPDDCLDVGPR